MRTESVLGSPGSWFNILKTYTTAKKGDRVEQIIDYLGTKTDGLKWSDSPFLGQFGTRKVVLVNNNACLTKAEMQAKAVEALTTDAPDLVRLPCPACLPSPALHCAELS